MAQFTHAQVKREHQENAILSFLDFSLTSQQIFFVILPAAALTLGTLYYACRFLGKPRVVKSGYLFWFKLVCPRLFEKLAGVLTVLALI